MVREDAAGPLRAEVVRPSLFLLGRCDVPRLKVPEPIRHLDRWRGLSRVPARPLPDQDGERDDDQDPGSRSSSSASGTHRETDVVSTKHLEDTFATQILHHPGGVRSRREPRWHTSESLGNRMDLVSRRACWPCRR